jgi:hypothetical protein
MASRIWRLARLASAPPWLLLTPAVQIFSRRHISIAFSRAFSARAAAPAPPSDAVDMSSTVNEMREFAVLHGISLKGLRLKADIFAAIQMHFGIFANVHAVPHSEDLKLQEDVVAASAPLEEKRDSQLKVVFLVSHKGPLSL